MKNQEEKNTDLSVDLVESLPIIVYRTEPEPPYAPIYISPAIETFGYPVAQWFARPALWSEILHPQDRERVLRETKNAFATRRDNEYEYRTVARDGSVFWVHDRGRFIYQGGKPVCWQGVILDITSRKRAEEAAELNEQRFRRAIDDAAIGMALVAPDGRWLRVNRALCELLGYTQDELLATSFQALTHPADLNADLEYVRQMLAGEIETYQLEKRYFHRNKKIVWSLLSVSLVRDSRGAPLYFISQIQDMTERRQAEEILRQSREQYRQLIDHASDIIYQTDSRGHFVFVNPTIIKMLQYTAEELLELTYLDVVEPDQLPAVKRFYTRQLLKKIPNTYHEFVAVAKDGSPVWLGQHVQLLTENNQVSGFQAIARDITGKKQLEEELRKLSLRDELTGLYNRRGFFALAEHQLKLALNKRHEKKLLAIYIDLDGLKRINDSFGHDEGSQAIIETAELLKRSFRQSDLVARLGGDEFVVLAIEAEEENTRMITDRLENNLKLYNQRQTGLYELKFSFGVARYHQETDDGIESFVNRADRAMYQQKRQKNSFRDNLQIQE